MTNAQPGAAAVTADLPSSQPLVDLSVAIQSILGFWAFYFVQNTIRMALAREDDQIEMIGRRLVVVAVSIGLTLILCWVLRRFERQPMRIMLAVAFAASVPASFGYAVVNYTTFYVVAPLESTLREIAEYPEKMHPIGIVADSAVSWYFFFAAWAVLYVALSYATKAVHAERTAASFRAAAQASQLRALRYQINPHFLFNTLNSLSTLVLQKRTDEADRMIMNLSTFFRTSLTSDPESDVPLADEIRMQRLYLDIEQIRFPDRLSVKIDLPAELSGARVPGLILQPVVENAIKHGVACTADPVNVDICVRKQGDRLHLTVEDNATGQTKPRPGAGVGLGNVRERLAARFGQAATLSYGPRPGGGFHVDIDMPFLAQG
ncbi:MAG: histidine kinase [Rhodobacteraceae bacterium]|nr:histidine kinase [Paracoccaceae bacterium]